jgi:hypothetical protein
MAERRTVDAVVEGSNPFTHPFDLIYLCLFPLSPSQPAKESYSLSFFSSPLTSLLGFIKQI